MKRISRLHYGNIGKSFSLAFVLITVIWAFVSYHALGRIFVSWQILLGNLAVSGVLSAMYYRFRYHTVLEYNDRKLRLHRGSSIIEEAWEDFSLLSLYHKGFGVFTLRLYHMTADDRDFIEIPASDLGLDPSELRFELMGHMQR